MIQNENVKDEKSTIQMVNVFKTSYHYYRNWVKEILTDGKVNDFKFVKDKKGWKGSISVPKKDEETIKKVLSDYKAKNPEIVPLWW